MPISISLGTAQFGFNYGITNKKGKVNEELVKEILKIAERNNFKYLDTAQSYGNAEEVIGRCNSKESKFEINSKLSFNKKGDITESDIARLEENFEKTLINLKTKSINSFLVHNVENLKDKKSKKLLYWLQSLKRRGLIKNIGISIYDTKELKDILLDDINLIQIPVSIYNQKMVSCGYLESLSCKGYLIHARSCFLQGLILTHANEWPKYISKDLKEHHSRTEIVAQKNNLTMLDLSLYYIKTLSFLDSIIVGITSISELERFINSWNKKNLSYEKIDFKKLSWDNKRDVDPRFWKNQ